MQFGAFAIARRDAALHFLGRLFGHERVGFLPGFGQVVAQRGHLRLEPLIEHIADHHQAALRPLTHAAEFGVIELSLATAAGHDRRQQLTGGIAADAVAAGNFRHLLLACVGQSLHGMVFPSG